MFDTTTPTYRFKRIKHITIHIAVLPYVSVGIGAAFNKTSKLRNTDPDTPTFLETLKGKSKVSFAWQTGVGLDYYFASHWWLELGYRFVDAGRVETSSTVSGTDVSGEDEVNPFFVNHLHLHEILLTIGYQF